jgi:hypothetical protein
MATPTTWDDGLGYGGTFCKSHSLRGADIGKDEISDILDLWNRAEYQARRTVTFDEFCGKLRTAIEDGTHSHGDAA